MKILLAGSSHAHGFTLLEMLVVIAIMGILTSMALPVFNGAVPGLGLAEATRQLMADLRLARRTAIADKKTVTIIFRPSQSEYAFGERRNSVSADMSVQIEAAAAWQSGEDPVLHFYQDGSGDPVSIKLSRGEKHKTIRVSWLTGQARLED